MQARLPIGLTAVLLASSAAAQLTTVSPGDTPIDWTSDGNLILVSGFSDWAVVDVAAGTRTPLPAGGSFPVAIADNGTILGAMTDPTFGANTSGLLVGGTWLSLGTMDGATSGCPDLSNPYDLDASGTIAVGLGWNVCSANAYRWEPGTGMKKLLPQTGPKATRANVISTDGSTIGGWDDAASGTRRAAVWYPDGTQELVNVTAANPTGVGETHGLSEDGHWACGSGLNGVGPFLHSRATGPVEIGVPPGGALSGTSAQSVSNDGKVVVGYQGNFLGSRAWIWTCSGGAQFLDTYLTGLGFAVPGNIATAIAVSPDGTRILGAWDNGGFSVDNTFIAVIPAQPTWAKYGVAASSTNILDLDGGGSTGLGQTFQPTVSLVPAAALFVGTGISLTPANLSLLGGVVLINPVTVANVLGFPAGTGSVTHTIPIPPQVDLWGVTVFLQSLCDDATKPQGFALSNGLSVSL
jgi:hypothetical protein